MLNINGNNKELFISYTWLINHGISQNTIDNWVKRNQSITKKIGINTFVLYDSIPAPTRSKLPSRETLLKLYKASQIDELTQQYFREMEYAQSRNFVKYVEMYREFGVKHDRVTDYAKKHAVWEVILEHYSEDCLHDRREIHRAYNMLYPDQYVCGSMGRAIRIARAEGIPAILVRRPGSGRPRGYDEVTDLWVMQALSSGKKYSSTKIHKLVSELCRESGRKPLSLSSIKRRIEALRPIVNDGRIGKDPHFYKKLPYQGIKKAVHSNDQWQIDGWRLPFYMKGFATLTLFWVLDACSGKVVGYHIDSTENTETILKGIENAVTDTGCLPFEIVSDNHSMNKTREAAYFKETIGKLGCQWNVSQNPRRKAVVERSFKVFGEQFCKDEYGYLGEGILSKNPDGKPSQELIDRYTREGGWLTAEQIKLVAIKLVEAYNNREDKEGKTPVIRYEENKQPDSIRVDKLDCLRMFVRESEYTIRRGQINIERAGAVYEFQLNKDQYLSLNDKRVRVRYSDFEEIYLFDIETDEALGSVPRKQYTHGAVANQTEEDRMKFFKHKGRLKGIQTGMKKRQTDIFRRAESIDPDAAYRMNAKLTPKNVVEIFRQDGELRKLAERQGIDINTVPDMPVFCESNTIDPDRERQRRDKRREQPVMATQEEIDNFNLNDYLLDD